ncbi:MAG: ribose-5-phosphate isomerase RpiA [Bacteroidota bacterium]
MGDAAKIGKKAAGEYAAGLVKQGMSVGLGTGSTVYFTLLKLGEMVREGLDIRGIPTSEQTAKIAQEQGITLVDFQTCDHLDLTIDGADEVDAQLNLIKGGGGALYREKMVASISDYLAIVADASKISKVLGSFALPVEIVPFGHELTYKRIQALGVTPELRTTGGYTYLTDNGNFILDCPFNPIENSGELHHTLKLLPGVVETGFFIGMAKEVIVGKADGEVEVIRVSD